MDNNRIVSEGLLRADGIDPAGATKSERMAVGKMLDEQYKRRQARPGTVRPGFRRHIMKNKLTKLVAAAILFVPIIMALNQLGLSIDGTTVVLADVAKRLGQVKNCVFKKTVTFTTEEGKVHTNEAKVYFAEAGVKQETYRGPNAGLQVYQLHSQKCMVWMNHDKRLYDKISLADADFDKHLSTNPNDLVNEILSKGEYEKLGKKNIDGVQAEGFSFRDKRTLLSIDKDRVNDVKVRIWVDVNTNLPLRIEMDCVFDGYDTELVLCDPQWDVELEDGFFEPHIPDSYLRPGEKGLVGMDLTNWPTLKVVPNMPAEKAGLQDGDIVLQIDDTSIPPTQSSGDAQMLLSGRAEEKVILRVKRGEQVLSFEIERASLPK